MKKISDKYTIYGRKKGRKKIHSVNKDFLVNYKINLETDIKNNKKNIIDVGSGWGENTLFLAKKNPDALIIAIEIFWDGNINLCKQLSKLKLYNVKIFLSNVLKLLDHLNKVDYFNEIWILFPDPWPKNKHFKRRLINDNFFAKVYPYILCGGGSLSVALSTRVTHTSHFAPFFPLTPQARGGSLVIGSLAETNLFHIG